MKKLFLVVAMAAISLSATAQYHGFSINASRPLLNNAVGEVLDSAFYNGRKGKTVSVFALYAPVYKPMSVDSLGNLVEGTWTKKDTKGTTMTMNTLERASKAISDGVEDAAVLTAELSEDGLCYYTVPSKYMKGETEIAAPDSGAVIRIRFDLAASPNKSRLGDLEDLRVNDISGVYLTVAAPQRAIVTTNFVQGDNATAYAADKGTPEYADNIGQAERTAVFELGSPEKDNKPVDLKFEGKASQCANVFSYKRTGKDANGYPLRYVDIVFYNLKPGDKVGWTNLQTLHEGYTPTTYAETLDWFKGSSAGIKNVIVDNNAAVEYYNLQGIKVNNPTKGDILIKRQGNKTSKTIIR